MFYLLSAITMFVILSIFTIYGYKKGINFYDGEALVKKRVSITKEEVGSTFFLILISSLIPVFGLAFLFSILLMWVCSFLYKKVFSSGYNVVGEKVANFINKKVLNNGK